VEQGLPEKLFTAAEHPYTRALLDAVPQAQPGRHRRRGAAQGTAAHAGAAPDATPAAPAPNA
jgi:ABC-type dipeptide/oligopeptide/nickel transport system ATPase component